MPRRFQRPFAFETHLRWVGLLALAGSTASLPGGAPRSFEVPHFGRETSEGAIEVLRLNGRELTRASPQARRQVPSMDQARFPEPESACGPVAILNWTLWYAENGLFGSAARQDARLDPGGLFAHIDREIMTIRGGLDRAPVRGATYADELICVFDRVVAELSGDRVRLSFEIHLAPMEVADLLRFTSGLRSAILVTRVVDDPHTGTLGAHHAVSAVAGDRAGYLMVNNWGEKWYGRLQNRPEGQFFVPNNPAAQSLKIEALLCFIPFQPE